MKKIERLGEYISEYSVRNKANEDIQVYSVTNTNGFCTEYFDKDVASKDQTNYKIVPKGYFAYNPSRINVGSIDCQSVEDRVIVSPLYVVFKADERVDNNYLLHYLKSDIGKKYINELASGSVRANLKFSILQEFPFPIIPIEEQKEKMAVIAKIDENIACCDSIIEKLDLAVKSRFIEMFENDLAGSCMTINDIAKDATVGIANSATHAYCDDGIVMLRNQNIRVNYLDDEDLIYIKPEFAAKYKSKALKKDDILVTRTGANVGMACIVPAKYEGCQTFTTLILRLKENVGILPEFVCHYINSPRGQRFVHENKVGGAQPNFGAKQLATMPIAVPEIKNQEEFVLFTKEVDKSKLAVQEMKNKMEILKASVMQEYFC